MEEGVAAVTRGLAPNVARSVLMSMLNGARLDIIENGC